MLPTNELLELYRAEKAALDDYANPFPSFSEWKADYVAEYNSNHCTVTVDEADQIMDSILAEAETASELNETTPVNLKEIEMHQTTETETTEVAAAEVVAPVVTETVTSTVKAPRKTSAKKTAVKAAKKTVTKSVKKASGEKSKSELSLSAIRRVWRNGTDFPRARVIEVLMSEVGLTKNGASTYAQTGKTKITAERKARAKA